MTNLKKFFPFYNTYPHASYLDNAAVTQKEESVLKEVYNIYTNHSFPVGRSHYSLAEKATELWSRKKEEVANYFSIPYKNFAVTASATTASNVLAANIAPYADPEKTIVIISKDVHHSLSAPWIKKYKGNIVWLSPNSEWEFNYNSCKENIEKFQEKKVYLLLSARSHVHGYTIDFDKLQNTVGSQDVTIIMDATQLAPHAKVNLAHPIISASFFSGHKIYSPYGTGCLYINGNLKKHIKATTFGGGNVDNLTETSFNEKDFPQSLEVGSPNLPSICALAASCKFIAKHDIHNKSYKNDLQKLRVLLESKKNIHIVSSKNSETILSFYHKTKHAHDIARELSAHQVYVRSGFMCSDSAHKDIPATIRISYACYNDTEDTQKALNALDAVL